METDQRLETGDLRPAKRAKAEAGAQGAYNSYELDAMALTDEVASAASDLGAVIENGRINEGGRKAGLVLHRILERQDELGKLLSSAGVPG